METPKGISQDGTENNTGQSNCIFSSYNLLEQIEYGAVNGTNKFILCFNPKSDHIPRNCPKIIKDDLNVKVTNTKNIEEVIHARNGKLLVITEHKKTAEELANIKTIASTRVDVHIQIECNTISFILNRMPTDTSLSEIKDEIEHENGFKVHSIRRFTKKGYNQPTETLLITIYGRILPTYIRIWMNRQKISQFFDKPRQCVKCFKFNHPTKFCKNNETCNQCGENHANVNCQKPLRCVNCQGAHHPTSKECPEYIKEMEFVKFKVLNGLSFSEARKRYREKTVHSTYAKITSSRENSYPSATEDINQKLKKNNEEVKITMLEMMKQYQAQMNDTLNILTTQISKNFKEALKEIKEDMFNSIWKEIKSSITQQVTESIRASNEQEMVTTSSPKQKKRKERKSSSAPSSTKEKIIRPSSLIFQDHNYTEQKSNTDEKEHSEVDTDMQMT